LIIRDENQSANETAVLFTSFKQVVKINFVTLFQSLYNSLSFRLMSAARQRSFVARRSADKGKRREETSALIDEKMLQTPTLAQLLPLSPSISSHCEKKTRYPILATIFPCCVPYWKKRFIVLAGNFVYRFFCDEGEEKVKGVPIPIETLSLSIPEPPTQDNKPCLMQWISLKKIYNIRFETYALAKQWKIAIGKRKLEMIQENLGHLVVRPEVRQLNATAQHLFDRKIAQQNRADYLNSRAVSNPLLSPNTIDEGNT
jgi:hypothetical protein